MNTELKQMWELAIYEATMLKQFATKKEIKALCLDIDGGSAHCCVYGKMTGHCYSERANELVEKCCIKVYRPNFRSGSLLSEVTLIDRPLLDNSDIRGYQYHSAIECLIYFKNAGQEAINLLIPFMKGEADSVEIPEKYLGLQNTMSSEQNAQASAATDDHSSTLAGTIMYPDITKSLAVLPEDKIEVDTKRKAGVYGG